MNVEVCGTLLFVAQNRRFGKHLGMIHINYWTAYIINIVKRQKYEW